MDKMISFELDGAQISTSENKTIWQIAHEQGTDIPHLCHSSTTGYQPDGNCRACMVEIDGERTLAASCIRTPTEGMVVNTNSKRAKTAQNMVMELLVGDQPSPELSPDRSSHLAKIAGEQEVHCSRFPAREPEKIPLLDNSHIAIQVNLSACIHCNLCVRACREVQVNNVIGMSGRGRDAKITFDLNDELAASTCVACGECVQACPTGALTSSSMLNENGCGDSTKFASEVESVCPYCGIGCKLNFKIRDDKIAWVEGADGPSNQQRLCVKGRYGFDYVHHPHRLKFPLIRRTDANGKPLAKGLNVDPENPFEYFRQASWEEALDAAAKGLAKLRDKHDGTSVAGFGSAKCSNEEAYLFQKLIRAGFGHNNLDHCTRLCHASSVAALMENVGSAAVTATFNEIENADCAIVIGANPVENHPVAATFFKQFAKRGGKLISIDPRGVGLSKHATHHLQFKPGTDVALLNAIMHSIVEENLYDKDYIVAHTEGWDEFKNHLKGFSPEKMSAICGVDATDIRQVARTFAGAKSAMIFWGMGISQHIHGTDNSRCLISLALMCGQVGRPGSGLHPLRGQNNVQGASDAGLIPMFLPDYQAVGDDNVRTKFDKVWGDVDFSRERGLTVVEIIEAIYAQEIKGMYILGENPAMSDPDVLHAREALSKLEHLVVQDVFLTETANFADVILPAAAWPEKTGTVTNTNRQVQLGRPAVPPPGEAKADWWITIELARRLGLDWQYTHPREVFAEMKMVMSSLDNITWERLEKETVTYPSLSIDDPGQAVVFEDGFPRPSGRAKFTPANIIAPDEVPDDQYPMILITGRILEHWHTGSMTRRSMVLDQIEPQAMCSLHPNTLRNLGIQAGEMIRLTTRRGSIELVARADRAVSTDTIFVPFAFVEAAANILTNSALDPFGKIPEFKYSAVRAEPVEIANKSH